MAIIKPDLDFEGGKLNVKAASFDGTICKEGIRWISFKTEANKKGVYLYILPAYKVSPSGRGIWYKQIEVRDQFGMQFKEKFPVGPNCPISYFEYRVKSMFPDYCKVEDYVKEGRTWKKFPTYGKISKRVIYNAAFTRDLGLGAHILELPLHGGADVLDKWHRAETASGRPRGMVNDPAAAVPIQFKLDLNTGGFQPWVITHSPEDATALPEQMCDTEYLYDLDNALAYRPTEELLEQLRQITPPDIFEAGMSGYKNGTATTMSMHVKEPPSQAVASVFNIPKATVGTHPVATQAPTPTQRTIAPASYSGVECAIPTVDIPKTNVSSLPGIDLAKAKRFLESK